MNPVDHVRLHDCHVTITIRCGSADTLCSLTVVVTTSILAKPRPSLVTPPRVKRLVSSPPDGQVCSVVRKRSRSRGRGRHEGIKSGWRLSQSQRLWPSSRHELNARRVRVRMRIAVNICIFIFNQRLSPSFFPCETSV